MLSHNLLAYCSNNAVNMYDPNGYSLKGVLGWGFSVLEGLAASGEVILSTSPVAWVVGAFFVILGFTMDSYTLGDDSLHGDSSSTSSNASSVSSVSSEDSSSGGGGGPKKTPKNPKNTSKIVKQIYHFLTNKSTKYTPQITSIIAKYELDLDDDWNKQLMEHLGRHCNKYHEFMLNSIRAIDRRANGDIEIFKEGFEKVKDYIKANPDKLYRRGW